MTCRWTFLAVLVAVAAGALVFRAPRLEQRPMHNDEAVHCDKFRILWETGEYVYDPYEYHGPPHYYFTLPVMWLTGTRTYADSTETTYRIVTVLFGVGLVLLLALVSDALGRTEALVAGVLTAISPAMVFYSRYYIQEILLVFFAFAAIAAAWRYSRSRRIGWMLLCGISIGMMHATKETWVLSAAAAGGAIALTILWTRCVDGQWSGVRWVLNWKHLAAGLVAGAVVASLFLSGFFTNLRGPWDSILTYTTYLNRGTKTDIHEQPWYYYLKILVYNRYGRGPIWSEGLIVGLAAVGLLGGLWRSRGAAGQMGVSDTGGQACPPGAGRSAWLIRFIAFYTLALVGIYSAIKYKTPWCLLNFQHGMILLAGVGAVSLVRWMPHWGLKVPVAALLLAAAVQLGFQAHRTSFHPRWMADPANPYAHSPTRFQALELAQRVEVIARLSPQGLKLPVHVLTTDCWPLPWYMRRLERVGYWPEPAADNASAPIIITAPEFQDQLQGLNKQLTPEYYQQAYYGLRPAVPRAVYIRKDLWDAFIQTRVGNKPAAKFEGSAGR